MALDTLGSEGCAGQDRGTVSFLPSLGARVIGPARASKILKMTNVRTEVLLGRLFETIEEGELTRQVSELSRFIIDHATDNFKVFLLDEVLSFDYYTALVHYLGDDVQQAVKLARLAAKDAHVQPPAIAREIEPDDELSERKKLRV